MVKLNWFGRPDLKSHWAVCEIWFELLNSSLLLLFLVKCDQQNILYWQNCNYLWKFLFHIFHSNTFFTESLIRRYSYNYSILRHREFLCKEEIFSSNLVSDFPKFPLRAGCGKGQSRRQLSVSLMSTCRRPASPISDLATWQKFEGGGMEIEKGEWYF